MENAANAVARVIAEKLGGSVEGKSILILCGKGNNGGDGLAVARILWSQGSNVNVCLMYGDEEFSGDARTNLTLIRKLHAGQIPFIDPTICMTEVGAHRSFFDNWDSYFGPDIVR
jgi:NAD(P)H-hydrate epimerase